MYKNNNKIIQLQVNKLNSNMDSGKSWLSAVFTE